jgi:hypothetical protein
VHGGARRHQQFNAALEWFRDTGQHLGADPIKLSATFHEFATSKGWNTEHIVAATSAYDTTIAEQGPAAMLEPTSAENDADVIARADALLKSDPDAY